MPESKSKRPQRRSRRPQAPQTPPRRRRTPKWAIPAFFTLIIAGALLLVLNYMQIFGGRAHNSLLFTGLGLMGASFVVATRIT